jgi:hypothetical protein
MAEWRNGGMAKWRNGGIADGRANCGIAAILIILWFSQYHKLIIFCTTNMVTNKSVAGKPAAISKKSPIKVTTPPKSPNPYNTSPKKNADEKKKSHNIIPLVDNDDTPYGWAFENFYNAKDFVKDLSNRNAALIFLGGLEFKSFSNLTTRWVKSSLVGGCLWVIHIDKTMDGTSGCFPMEAHIAYAKKIARAVIHDNTFDGEKVDLITKNLSESEVADLDSYFSTAAFDEAREAIFHEAIQEADATIEGKI